MLLPAICWAVLLCKLASWQTTLLAHRSPQSSPERIQIFTYVCILIAETASASLLTSNHTELTHCYYSNQYPSLTKQCHKQEHLQIISGPRPFLRAPPQTPFEPALQKRRPVPLNVPPCQRRSWQHPWSICSCTLLALPPTASTHLAPTGDR